MYHLQWQGHYSRSKINYTSMHPRYSVTRNDSHNISLVVKSFSHVNCMLYLLFTRNKHLSKQNSVKKRWQRLSCCYDVILVPYAFAYMKIPPLQSLVSFLFSIRLYCIINAWDNTILGGKLNKMWNLALGSFFLIIRQTNAPVCVCSICLRRWWVDYQWGSASNEGKWQNDNTCLVWIKSITRHPFRISVVMLRPIHGFTIKKKANWSFTPFSIFFATLNHIRRA